ncbi:MAG: GGDEF domain-containing phosphodiesterase [Lachnospiraceae bacterium]|nr:GGDEF domain-containing phosphodiesterase [Lachnospiraceae bacterium]
MEHGSYYQKLPEAERLFLAYVEKLAALPVMLEVVLEHVSEALAEICPYLHIGKVEGIMDTPPNRLVPDGITSRRLLFSDGIVDVFNPISITYDTEEGGKITYEFYWSSSNPITEEGRFWTGCVAEMLYLYMGRARISSMLHSSMGTDPITGLPNMGAFFSQVERIIEAGRIMDYVAAYFNIRNFKYINKLVSFQDGNGVMRQYAGKVRALIGHDEVIARLGGDNYVVLVRKDRSEDFLNKLEKIHVDVATTSGVRSVPLSVRVGIYEVDRPLHVADEIMTPISIAQQVCRENVTASRIYYTPEMAKRVFHEKKVSMDFTRALAEGQFHAYYQPKIRLSDGSLCGAEALARWELKGEVILPGKFVPMLEKDGTVRQLDFEMLRQTCEMISKWIEAGKEPVPISVNMSRWHLKDENFVETIREIAASYQVPPKWIEIEVTETVDFEEYHVMLDVLQRLKDLGFSTSIDDFGSGYSSLTLLHRIDVDVIKLDQSFLWEQSAKGNILIRNVIRMAKELGIAVLAEGVETVEHRDFLMACNCDMAQGFLYAMPLRKEEFERRAFS